MTFMVLYSRVIDIEFYVMLLLFNLISLLVSIITSFALFKLKVEPAMPKQICTTRPQMFCVIYNYVVVAYNNDLLIHVVIICTNHKE